jgi:single-strand DNA-binding protein
MAFVRVEQRNAHLAGSVRREMVNGRDGNKVAKATLTATSNTRRGSGEERADEATAIQWTLWGQQAENAAEYLGKGSHVNIVGRLRNNNYTNNEGTEVYGFGFSCEEIDYLDSRGESEARRARGTSVDNPASGTAVPGVGASQSAPGRGRKGRTDRQPAHADA